MSGPLSKCWTQWWITQMSSLLSKELVFCWRETDKWMNKHIDIIWLSNLGLHLKNYPAQWLSWDGNFISDKEIQKGLWDEGYLKRRRCMIRSIEECLSTSKSENLSEEMDLVYSGNRKMTVCLRASWWRGEWDEKEGNHHMRASQVFWTVFYGIPVYAVGCLWGVSDKGVTWFYKGPSGCDSDWHRCNSRGSGRGFRAVDQMHYWYLSHSPAHPFGCPAKTPHLKEPQGGSRLRPGSKTCA